MAKALTNEDEAQTSESDKVKASAEKRRNLKNSSRRSRWVGLILFLLCLVLGFLLWVGGEGFAQPVGEKSQSRSPSRSTPQPRGNPVIIIE